MNPSHELVRVALCIGALELLPEGIRLKSGRISPYFFNSGFFDTGGRLAALADAYTRTIVASCHVVPDTVLFGPAYKGILLVAAIATRLADHYNLDVGYACNRKESKDHGEGGEVIGHPLQGKQVIIVDDVITSGTSIAEAVHCISAHGGTAVQCIVGFDREEIGTTAQTVSAVQQTARTFGIPVTPVAKLCDLVAVLQKDRGTEFPLGPRILPLIAEYRDRYGCG